jgi:peptidoglycan/xylan/chitin deacetylase (PgdA/CDA1 family)
MAPLNETIITFHGLGEPPADASNGERGVWVPLDWFEALVEAAPASGLGFAFDDGNSSDLELAVPILQRRGLTARFFILSGRLGQPGHLSADAVVELHRAGMTVGSHGLGHRDWCELGDEELRAETLESRAALAKLIDAPVTEAAPPFGSYDRRVLRFLREAGYERVFTSDGGPGRVGARVMGRTSVGKELPLEHWLGLARRAGTEGPGLALRAKRLLKQIR